MTSTTTSQATGTGSAQTASAHAAAAVSTPMSTSAPAMSLPARLLGVLFSPRATYAAIANRPRWFGAAAFVLLLGAAAIYIFLSTDVGQQASLDNQIRQMESFGRPVTDLQYQRMEQMAPYAKYFGAGFYLVLTLISALVIAGVVLAVFNAALGGDGSFKQVFSIVSHSGVVLSVAQLFGLPLAWARESLSGATNLAVFAPFLDENTFAARVLGSVDLFIVWWIISLAIGLGVLYRKRTTPIASTMLVIYVAIGVVIAAIKSAVSGA